MTLSYEAIIPLTAALIGMAGYALAALKRRQQQALKPVRVKARRR